MLSTSVPFKFGLFFHQGTGSLSSFSLVGVNPLRPKVRGCAASTKRHLWTIQLHDRSSHRTRWVWPGCAFPCFSKVILNSMPWSVCPWRRIWNCWGTNPISTAPRSQCTKTTSKLEPRTKRRALKKHLHRPCPLTRLWRRSRNFPPPLNRTSLLLKTHRRPLTLSLDCGLTPCRASPLTAPGWL